MKISKEIKKLREQIGLTPRELASRSNLSPAYISKLEKGEYESFSLKTSKALADGFGMTLREFLEAIKFMEVNERRPSAKLISEAFRSEGYTEEQIEKIKEYANFIKNQQKY